MTIAIIIVAAVSFIVIVIQVFNHLFYSSFLRRAEQIRNEAGSYNGKIVSEADLKMIPTPVAKYLELSGIAGRKMISSVHIQHSGKFRPGADKSFLDITGEYFMTMKRPSFCWFGTISFMPGIKISAFDSYFNGHGRMLVKLMSFYKIADARNHETSVSALGRCVAEMTMAPSFFLNEQITWTAFDAEKAFCTVEDSGLKVNARIYFHDTGELDRIEIDRLFDRGKGKFTTEKFTGRASVFKEFNGIMIPSVLDGIWNLEEGDLHYVHFKIDEIKYE